MTNVTQVRRRKRRLRRSIKYGLWIAAAIVFLVLIFTTFIPLANQIRLTKMGYSKVSAKSIREQKLTKEVLSREYSEAFDINMENGIIAGDNLELYYVSTNVNDKVIELNKKLIEKGYSETDLLNGFKSLDYDEMLPLMILNNITDMNAYIEDVLAYHDSDKYFISDFEKYTIFYENATEIKNPSDLDALVNKYNKIPEDYVPDDLVECSTRYATSGIKVRSELYEAFKEMCAKMNDDGLKGMYIISGYRTNDKQTSLYKQYYRQNGLLYADAFSARAGHSEHQLGLAIDVTVVGFESAGFVTSPHSEWMAENSYKYGFILRYTDGYTDKEHKTSSNSVNSVTGYSYEPWHYRYLGVDLATAVYESGLTYDEYYEMYLRNE